VLLDPLGNVAELATANIFYARGGEVHTPVPNGTFLDGVTRRRVISLLRRAGVTVHERSLSWREFIEADEVFSTGNYGKLMPITRVEDRDLQLRIARSATSPSRSMMSGSRCVSLPTTRSPNP